MDLIKVTKGKNEHFWRISGSKTTIFLVFSWFFTCSKVPKAKNHSKFRGRFLGVGGQKSPERGRRNCKKPRKITQGVRFEDPKGPKFQNKFGNFPLMTEGSGEQIFMNFAVLSKNGLKRLGRVLGT